MSWRHREPRFREEEIHHGVDHAAADAVGRVADGDRPAESRQADRRDGDTGREVVREPQPAAAWQEVGNAGCRHLTLKVRRTWRSDTWARTISPWMRPSDMLRLIFGFRVSQAVHVAAELRHRRPSCRRSAQRLHPRRTRRSRPRRSRPPAPRALGGRCLRRAGGRRLRDERARRDPGGPAPRSSSGDLVEHLEQLLLGCVGPPRAQCANGRERLPIPPGHERVGVPVSAPGGRRAIRRRDGRPDPHRGERPRGRVRLRRTSERSSTSAEVTADSSRRSSTPIRTFRESSTTFPTSWRRRSGRARRARPHRPRPPGGRQLLRSGAGRR